MRERMRASQGRLSQGHILPDNNEGQEASFGFVCTQRLSNHPQIPKGDTVTQILADFFSDFSA
ncbi:MAG: hypothetical protein ACOYYJ_04100 [Chloroflexota bacterium]